MKTKLDKATVAERLGTASQWHHVTRWLYASETQEKRITRRRATLAKDLADKYHDNNAVLSAEIAELDAELAELSEVGALCVQKLSDMGEKDLTDWQHNYAVAEDAYYSGDFTRGFRGADKKMVDEIVGILRGEILTPAVERILATDDKGWTEASGDYLDIITRGEYKRIQNLLGKFAKTIYGANYKFKADSVAFFMFSTIKPNKVRGLEVASANAVRSALIMAANRQHFGKDKDK